MYNDNSRLMDLVKSLALVDCYVSLMDLQKLTDEQIESAEEWSELCFLEFRGQSVNVPEKPEFLPELTYK